MKAMGELVAEARELCGCTQCQGGYEIGAKTIAAPSPSDASAFGRFDQERPYSCLAALVLQALVDGKLP